ncbi:MAG: ABC transporter substrate-binding protein, partial [Phycisphaerales bacterium]|nr:ABC transporter substrate-binding protein [Phycisphaerales bacterium]
WLDPVYCGGHWVPEMIAAAGGADPFGTVGKPSHPLRWEAIAAADPDVILLMPCGFHAEDVVGRFVEIASAPEFGRLRAVRTGNVYAVDATAYFSRPGPRIVEGVRILARILHPDCVSTPLQLGEAYQLTASGGFQPYL